MTVDIRVLAQYYENYNVDGGEPHWKPKGGHEFVFENVNSDAVMYAYDLKAILKRMVAAQSDSHNKFEYIEHDVLFFKPKVLNNTLLLDEISGQWERVNAEHGID